eukprot:371801-Amphidinium_carterae.1
MERRGERGEWLVIKPSLTEAELHPPVAAPGARAVETAACATKTILEAELDMLQEQSLKGQCQGSTYASGGCHSKHNWHQVTSLVDPTNHSPSHGPSGL